MEAGSIQIIVGWSGSWQAAWLGNRPGRSLATKAASGRLSNPAGCNASEAFAGLESEVADADPPEIRGRPHGTGKQPTRAPVLVRRGIWARHAGKVVRVIGGDPSVRRLRLRHRGWAMERMGVGQGRTTIEAG